jgi:hypothetical protein
LVHHYGTAYLICSLAVILINLLAG